MTELLLPSRVARKTSVFITPFSIEANTNGREGLANPATAVWPTTNLALFVPFSLPEPTLISRFFWCNGTTASTNNLQVGVYDGTGTAIKLGTSTLATGASQPQFDNVADFWLSPDKVYYMALWCNGTTTHIVRGAASNVRFDRPMGYYQVASLAGGLTSTVTFAAFTTINEIPVFGLTVRASP